LITVDLMFTGVFYYLGWKGKCETRRPGEHGEEINSKKIFSVFSVPPCWNC
jgi:hypothetical protein